MAGARAGAASGFRAAAAGSGFRAAVWDFPGAAGKAVDIRAAATMAAGASV